MKKVALSLAGVLAAAAFAPEASALPVFARQTGMACNACHFQHFPLLNGFGRSFKASGFTLMGAEGKVEGDDLSIPNVVNAAILTSMGYEKANATKAPGYPSVAGGGAVTGAFFTPGTGGEASLFVGGRGSDFMGFLGEVVLWPAAALDSIKTPILFEVASGVRAGVVFFSTNAQGASYGFETLNTGANAIHVISNTPGFTGQYANAISAQQYIGTAGFATGASVVVNSDMGFVNLTKFDQVGIAGVTFAALGSTYGRVAGTFDLGGWDTGVGVQYWGGNSLTAVLPAPAPAATLQQTRATAVDFQMQGTAGAMPLGLYATWASAPKGSNGMINTYNAAGTSNRTAITLAAELGVVPEKATVAIAGRIGKSGTPSALIPTSTSSLTDNAIYLTATYKLAQNLLTRLSYVHNMGTYWTDNANANQKLFGTNVYTVNLYALF